MVNPLLDRAMALALLAVAAWLAWAPAPRPRLVVIGVEGLSWPELAPAIREAPRLARLAGAQHALLTGSAGTPLKFLWDWSTTARPVIPVPRGQTPRRALAVWDVAAARGLRALVVAWPGQPGVSLHPPAGDPPPVVPSPLAPALAEPFQTRLAADRGAAALAVRLAAQHPPDLVFVGLQGPGGAAPAGYWPALDAVVGQLADLLGPGATVVLIGRGSGKPGTPAGEGVWIASGAGLATGPRPGPVRHLEVGPTLLDLAGLPLPAGALGRPSAWVRDRPPEPDWQDLP